METFTAKEIAILANTTPKRMRSFIRAQAEKGNTIVAPVGSGARYSFTKDEAHALVSAFNVRRHAAGSPVTRDLATLQALMEALDDDGDAFDDDGDDDDEAPFDA